MTTIEFIEAWWLSVRELIEARGVTGQFVCSSADRLNPSCSLNLRRGECEADLVLWESGESELSTIRSDGYIQQKHFADVRIQSEMIAVLVFISTWVMSQ